MLKIKLYNSINFSNDVLYPEIKYKEIYEGEQHLRVFKYKGGTSSYSYSLVWSPLADRLTVLFPTWMAPNVITLIALCLLVVVHWLFYLDNKSNGIDGWKLYLMGISILIYQTLDNIDGKQARRTGTSSVLGMLLDHGSDSISGFLITIQMIDVLFIEDSDLFYAIIFFFLMVSFFLAMSTQYATGEFKLGQINAIDEGLPSYAIIALIAAHVDFSVLKEFHIFGTYVQELLIFLTVLNIFMQYGMIKNILQNPQKPILEIARMWLLPISIAISLLILRFLGPASILNQVKYTLIYIVMFMWARNMTLIQLCYATKQKYEVFNRGTNIFILGIFVFLANFYLDIISIDTLLYFRLFLIIQVIVFAEFIFSSFQSIANALNIKIFTIPSS